MSDNPHGAKSLPGFFSILLLLSLLTVRPATVHAQAARVHERAALGSVSGDVYLAMQDGEVRRIAANAVFLVSADSARVALARCASAAHVDSILVSTSDSLIRHASTGSAEEPQFERLEKAKAARLAVDSARQRIAVANHATFVAGAAATTITNVDGHFRMRSIKHGDYALFAETTVGSYVYSWLMPVSLKAGAETVQDLNNTNIGAAYCAYPIRAQ